MEEKYYFYLQEVDKDGKALDDAKSVEDDFGDGVRYLKAAGIDVIGKPKNIYTESYAESDKLRTYIPPVIANEPTTITLSIGFFGDDRHKNRDAFNEYIRKGYHKFWDTFRKKSFTFFVQDTIEPTEENFFGNNPYIKMDYKLKNIKGKTENV